VEGTRFQKSNTGLLSFNRVCYTGHKHSVPACSHSAPGPRRSAHLRCVCGVPTHFHWVGPSPQEECWKGLQKKSKMGLSSFMRMARLVMSAYANVEMRFMMRLPSPAQEKGEAIPSCGAKPLFQNPKRK